LVADVALGEPVGGIVEIAGPETFPLAEVIRMRLGEDAEIAVDPEVGYIGAAVEERTLVPGEGARLGQVRFASWLSSASGSQRA
jgi:hypothetical protein